MAVTITDSVGYEGTIEEPDWARLQTYAAGRQYGVIGEGDWKVTAGAADREVRIAPGFGFGAGVLDRTTAAASLVLPAPSSDSVWHLIVAHRDWQANTTTFDVINGTSGAAAIPTRQATPGTLDDQPIALVRVQAGQSQVAEIRDLRVWGGYGGAVASDDLVRQYLTQLGTNITIAGIAWRRDLNSLGNPVWVKVRPMQGGQLEALTNNAAQASPGSDLPIIAFAVAEAVPAGSMLHIHADIEIYIPPADKDMAGFLRIYRGDTLLAQRRWHSQGRRGRFTYPSVEVNLPITQDIPTGTTFRFAVSTDPLSGANVDLWHGFLSWGVS
ncbi:hypothetical protein J2X55_002249 [Microbacterium sp. 1154]|uniref:hypothetical protein n=1 Tax=Microbacterium sp. 1154 TaxID=2817733 RepID=UPI00285B6BF1|nr:hypothetical protein [Microbacterium sp. 1154]MDR6691337.1 hypothetical protein [Microbacterium sp. 1154]